MPYYDYRCKKCGKEFEVEQTFEEHDRHEDHVKHQPLKCPKCGGRQLEQVFSGVFVVTSKKS